MAVSKVDAANQIENQLPQANIANNTRFRNIIINGDMSVAQRETSVTGITTTSYNTVDRFKNVQTGGAGTWTQSQSTDVPTGQGFVKSLKYDCTIADASIGAASVLVIQTFFEGQNLQYLKKGTSSAESLTLSFWVKSSKTGTYIAELYDNDNLRQISKAYTIDTADTWEKKTLTYAGDTTGTFDNDNNGSLIVGWWLAAGSNWTSGTLNTSWNSVTTANRAVGQVNLADDTANEFYITGVQLEAGDTASDFEFLPYDVNLRRCYRYFYKVRGTTGSTGYKLISSGFNNGGGTSGRISMILPESMRSTPTISYAGPVYFDGSTQRTITSVGTTIYSGGDNGRFFFDNTLSGSQTQGSGGAVFTDNATTAYMQFYADL